MSINAFSTTRFSSPQAAVKFQGQGLSPEYTMAKQAATLLGQSGLKEYGVSTATELALQLQGNPDLMSRLADKLHATVTSAHEFAGYTA